MDIRIIGNQIQKFRKQQGMTQKELGTAIGVSTQAVSQWECGGAPDIALLPAIADKLGVTIDALFGREGGAVKDMTEAVTAWLRTQPDNTRMQILTRLIWHLALHAVCALDIPKMEYLKSCEYDSENGVRQFMKSRFSSEDGYIYGVAAEDMSFMSIFPEPAEGYQHFFADNETYRTLFTVLAMPGTLELLLFLSQEEERFYLASTVARHIGLTTAETSMIFEKLTRIGILHKIELNLDEDVTPAYMMPNNGILTPLLYFSRWLCDNDGAYFVNIGKRRPSLTKKGEYQNETK